MPARPRLAVSQCLLEEGLVRGLSEFIDVTPLCPRLSLRISYPREFFVLSELENSLEIFSPRLKLRVTEELIAFASSLLPALQVDGFLLRSESPFCGVKDAKVYGRELKVVRRDDGFFTRCVRKHQPLIPVESHGRLSDYEVRRAFFTRVFALAELRSLLAAGKERELVEFHRRHKYLIMLHSPHHLKLLGNIAANRQRRPLEEVKRAYAAVFMEALAKKPSVRSYVNVFYHLYGHMKRRGDGEAVRELIRSFEEGRATLRQLLSHFMFLAEKAGNSYVLSQSLFAPYPQELEALWNESPER